MKVGRKGGMADNDMESRVVGQVPLAPEETKSVWDTRARRGELVWTVWLRALAIADIFFSLC